ncbi:MAG: hypothetical protein H0U95_18405 [Bacteroidetes bacterium]|nr:hypothetical protein [Bacteroidota bacterium]
MYSKDPVWLLPEALIGTSKDFCFKNNITERVLRSLVDAFLLRARSNRNSKKTEILQESFEQLQRHINYNFLKRTANIGSIIPEPEYINKKYKIFYDKSQTWYTPKEILETYPFLKLEKSYTCEFIGDLVQIGMVIGKFQRSEDCFFISLPSFVWLLKYHEFTVSQFVFLRPDDDFC